MEDDTIKLLRECNAGIKMGISSLDDVMDHVKDNALEKLLMKSKDTHCKLGDETHDYLQECHDEGKEPAAMAKMMRAKMTRRPKRRQRKPSKRNGAGCARFRKCAAVSGLIPGSTLTTGILWRA